MISLGPQLAFSGQCRQAFEFYAHLLGGEVTVMNTFGGNETHALPPGSTAGPSDKVRYAELRVDSAVVRGNDVSDSDSVPMAGFSLSLHFTDIHDARRVFATLGEGGVVNTPLSQVDWAELFGMVTDRFGVPWLILALKSQ